MPEHYGISTAPVPPPEQLAEWQALIERVRQGDESELVPWDDIAAELGL